MVSALRRGYGRDVVCDGHQRSRVVYRAPIRALRATGKASNTTACRRSTACVASQCQRLSTALASQHEAVAWVKQAAQSCRLPHPWRWRANGRASDTTAFSAGKVRCLQPVGTALARYAKALGHGSLTHRAGSALSTSVTMCPRESLRFVTVAHRHLSPACESIWGQPAAKAGYRPCRVRPHRQCFATWQSELCGAGCGHGSLRIVAGISVRSGFVFARYGKIT